MGGGTHNQTHNGLTIRLTIGLTIRLTIGLTIRLTTDSQWTHNGLTMDSQRTHNGLTMDSQWTHNGLTMDSQRTHKGLTKDSHRIHTKINEKALVFLGCPRKRLFLHWFYKVVREKGCFYTGFIRLSAKNVVFTMVLQGLSTKNIIKPVQNQYFSWTTRPA